MAEPDATDRVTKSINSLINSNNVLIKRLDTLMTPAPRDTTGTQPVYVSGRWWRRDGNGYGLDSGSQPANYPYRKVPV